MNIREEAVVDLRVDDTDAAAKWENNKARIKELQNELKALREAGEQGSDGYKALQRELSAVKAEQTALKHDIDLSTASIGQMQSALSYWVNEAKKAEQGSEEWIRATKKIEEIRPVLNEANAELQGFGREVEKQPSMWENFKVSALSVFTGMGLLELFKSAASAAWEFGQEIFEITGRFQRYEAVLANALGSQEQAAAVMENLKKLAAETPFGVDELTESYVKYVNRGIQPTMEEMVKLGDIAASQGKSFDQLTEAVLDAGSGEFERLKEFGIRASKSGDEVTFAFKGVEQTVKMTEEAIMGALLTFGEMEGVAGGMAVVSQTLEGRVSNLADSWDNVKLILGDFLMPVFNALLDLLADGVELAGELLSGNVELGENATWLGNIWNGLSNIFAAIWDVLKSVGSVLWDVIGNIVDMTAANNDLSGSGRILEGVLTLISGAIRLVGTVLIGALTGVQALFDGFNILINKGKEIANFFGADFKVDTNATFDRLKQNAENNLKQIENLWAGAYTKGEDAAKKSMQATTATHATETKKQVKQAEKASDEEIKAAKKAADQKAKEQAALTKKLEDMQVKAISDDTKRAVAKAELDYKREQDAIKKSLADDSTKKKALEAAEKKHIADLKKIHDDAEKKEAKEKAAAEKKADQEKKKEQAELKKANAQRLADSKKLLDDEFKAAAAKAKIELALTKENSQAMWNAKRSILEQEAAYKTAKLAQEAAEEKARIAESVADRDMQAQMIKAIEERLSAETKAIETDLQTAKTQLQTDANAARKANTEEFYSALNTAMTGDMNAFLDFLKKKDNSEATSLQKRMQDNLEHVQGIGEMMNTAVNALIKLNADYTQKKLDKLKEEYDANVAKLEADYEKGIITHEELEAGKLALSEEYDAENAALKKKEFERNKKLQIASALIAGSMAVLSALATPPFFVGLALAVVAAAKTAIDIAKIKNQKFEGARGGVFKNAGVTKGSRHGSQYGDAGIVMHDRVTGEEVGEIEGGEPVMVLSRTTYRNNKPVIDRLLHSSLYRNGAPIHLERGGMFNIAAANAYQNRMYAEGGVIGYESGDTSGISDDGTTAQSQAVIEENKRIQEEMKKYQERTANGVDELVKIVKGHTGLLTDIKNKDTGANTILHAIDRLKSNIIKASA